MTTDLDKIAEKIKQIIHDSHASLSPNHEFVYDDLSGQIADYFLSCLPEKKDMTNRVEWTSPCREDKVFNDLIDQIMKNLMEEK